MAKRLSSISPKKARILIVDDHSVMRFGLRQLIEDEPNLEICGEAEGVAQALKMINETEPDVAIVDLSLKDGSGLDLIEQIGAIRPETKRLVVSMYEEYTYAERALRAGAMGYLNKQEATDRVVEAINLILRGKVFLSDGMAEQALGTMVGGGGEESGAAPAQALTNRELEVFEQIGAGQSTREIAKRLHLSVKTIESHRANIKRKLGIDSGVELNRRAVEWVVNSQSGHHETAAS